VTKSTEMSHIFLHKCVYFFPDVFPSSCRKLCVTSRCVLAQYKMYNIYAIDVIVVAILDRCRAGIFFHIVTFVQSKESL
jgi:hypothetical protein